MNANLLLNKVKWRTSWGMKKINYEVRRCEIFNNVKFVGSWEKITRNLKKKIKWGIIKKKYYKIFLDPFRPLELKIENKK